MIYAWLSGAFTIMAFHLFVEADWLGALIHVVIAVWCGLVAYARAALKTGGEG